MTEKCCITITDEVECTVTGLNKQHHSHLYNEFGIMVENAFHMPSVKLGRWDGKVRFYDAYGKVSLRLLDEVIPYIVAWGYEVDIVDKRTPVAQPTKRVTEDQFAHMIGYGGKPLMIRPYQVECMNALVDNGSGFVIAATGAGKTLMTAALCDVYGDAGHKTLVIVPSGDLVTQTHKAFLMAGLDVGRYDGNNKEIDAQHVIATWQSLQNNPHLMKLFGMVVVDEAHGAKADVVQNLINKHGKHIAFRFGVTGTFPKPKTDQYSLKASIGIVRYQITARWLIDNGYLAEIDIEMYETVDDQEPFPDYASEKGWLSKYEPRLQGIAAFVEECRDKYGNTLVLTNDNAFGKRMVKYIDDSIFMYGETDNKDRQVEYDLFEQENDKILVCSSGIAKQGISIDRIFCLVLIDAGKSFVAAIQSVGRGLRMADDKNEVKVMDVSSGMKYSRKHRKDRMKYFREAEYPYSKLKKLKY